MLADVMASNFDALTGAVGRARTRRDALKLLGKGMLGVAVGASAAPALGSRPAAAADECLVEYPPADLDNCPNRRHHPGAVPSVNGCGPADGIDLVPDTFGIADFTNGCNVHDQCYGTCNSDRLQCDADMADAMRLECTNKYGDSIAMIPLLAACYKVADNYKLAVNLFGGGPWETAQKEDCECCHPVPPQAVYCACNDTCYQDAQTCLGECRVTLGCFSGICRPATAEECAIR